MEFMFDYMKLGKFTYHIISNKRKIKPFLVRWIGEEWENDRKEYPNQPWTIEWLNLLLKMTFESKIIDLNKIKLRHDLMNYSTDSYKFLEDLKERAVQMGESILRGSSIGPLLVNKTNYELMDGYTRYIIQKKHGQKKIYVYLGTILRFNSRN